MASEVGSGQISIFPVFNGFRSRVNAEVGSASTDAGQSSGRQFGAAFGRGAGNVGADSAQALTKNVATASAALSKARLVEQDSAGKVRVAEAQLAEARSTGAAGSAKVVAAEERLAAATRKLEEAQDKAKDSSTRLTGAQSRLQQATEATASAAGQGASAYSRGWAGLKEKLSSTIRGALDEANAEAESSSGNGGAKSGNAFTEGFKKAMGALAAVFAVDKVKDFFVSGVSGAADLEQSVGAIEAVFKSGSSQMAKWSESASTDVGLTKNEFNELGTLIGAQLKNGGTAMEDLAPKTQGLIGLGADLSSMFGGSTADAVSALSSALKGERDPIEKYGVSLKQASIDAEAASLGFEKVGGSLSDEAQQAATLSLIMKQTSDAHGNFAREGDTLAHKQQVLSAMWSDAKTQLASALLPAITAVAGFLISGLGPALGFAEKVMKEVTGGVRAFGAAFVAADGDITSNGFPGFMERLGYLASQLIATLRPIGTEIVGGVRAFGAAFVAADGDITSAGFPGFMERLGFIASQLVEKFKSVASGLQGLFSGMDFSQLGGLAAAAAGLGVALAGPGAAIAGLVTKFAPLLGTLGKFAPLLKFMTGPLGLLAGLFVAAYSTSEPFRTAINGLVATVGTLVSDLLGSLVPVLTTLVSTLLPVVAQIFTALVPVFAQVVAAVVPLVSQLLVGLMPVITMLITTVLPVLMQIFQALIPVLLMVITQAILPLVQILLAVLMPVLQSLMPIVMTVFGFIQSTIQNAMTVVQGIIKVVTSLIKGDWAGVWEGIKQIASGVWSQIQNVINTAINLVKGIINAVMTTIGAIWNGAWSGIAGFVSGIWNNIISGASGMIGGLIGFFAAIPGKIIGALAGLGTSLFGIGRDVVQGLLDGVASLAGTIGSFFLNLLPGWIVAPFKLALGINSPSKLFRKFGRNIPEGLIQGVEDEASSVEQSMRNLVKVPVAVRSSATGSSSSTRSAATSQQAGVQVVVQGNVGWEPEKVADELFTKIRRASSLANLRKVAVQV